MAPLAIAVAFPVLVTGPVKFALVTTVVAFPFEVTIPVKFALVVTVAALPAIFVWSPLLVPDKLATAPLANIALVMAPLAIAVAFPELVTGPVKFALVTTVVAFPFEVTIPVKSALVALAAATKAVVANAVVLLPKICVTPIVPVGNVGVPVNVGEADKTTEPVPVSSVKAVAIFEDENEPKVVVFPVDVIAPVKSALVVTVAALPAIFV